MSIDLNDFAATLAIGGGSVFLTFLLINIFFNLNFIQKSFFGVNFSKQAILLLMISFSFGVLIEDISNEYSDIDNPFLLKTLDFPQESDIRSNALLGFSREDVANCVDKRPVVKSFGLDFVKAGHLPRQPEDPDLYCEWIRDIFQISTTSLYYEAKSVVYREDNYFSELSKIQSRIDFSRSVSIGSILFALMTAVCLIISIASGRHRKMTSAHEIPASNRPINFMSKAFFYDAKRLLKISIIMILILFAAHMAGRFAYAAEEREFDLRVFGYYQSLRIASSTSSKGDACY